MRKLTMKRPSLRSLTLPGLSFVLAMFFGALLIAFSDSTVLKHIGHPITFIKSAGVAIWQSYLALFEGSVYNPSLAKPHDALLSWYPLLWF